MLPSTIYSFPDVVPKAHLIIRRTVSACRSLTSQNSKLAHVFLSFALPGSNFIFTIVLRSSTGVSETVAMVLPKLVQRDISIFAASQKFRIQAFKNVSNYELGNDSV
jgi:hypothetical protein